MPLEETSGVCRQFTCKYHAWRYDLDGNLTFVQQEEEFFDDKSRYGLVSAHCDVWQGFIFVNFASNAEPPEQTLRDFLGPMITGLEGYPFSEMTSRFYYRSAVKANWKPSMDAFQEFYHAPVLYANQSPSKYSKAAAEAGFEAPHYRIDGPHRLVSTSGIRAWEMDAEIRKPNEDICQSGLFGPWDKPDLGDMPPGLNPAKCDPWGLHSFQLFPNFVILVWGQGWYLTHHYWPTSYNSHLFEGTLYFPKPRTPRERIAQELAALSFKEYGLQDANTNTLEATQTMVESQVVDKFLPCDQEVEGWHVGPRIVPVGHAVRPYGGHLGPTVFHRLAPGIMPLSVAEGIANGVDDVRACVRYQIRHGARLIKVSASGGVMPHSTAPGAQQYSDEEFAAIADEAHGRACAWRRTPSGTAPSGRASGPASTASSTSPRNRRHIAMMVDHGTFLVSTTYLTEAMAVGTWRPRRSPRDAHRMRHRCPGDSTRTERQRTVRSGGQGHDAHAGDPGRNGRQCGAERGRQRTRAPCTGISRGRHRGTGRSVVRYRHHARRAVRHEKWCALQELAAR
ncbi:hypothetical protein ACVWWN_003290 [Mycobacterium sp. URHB0021]